MRVVIDLQGAQTESRFRGIGRYSMSLVKAMAKNAGSHEIWIALNAAFPDGISEIRSALDGIIPQSRIRQYQTFQDVAWESRSAAWKRNASERMWEHFIAGIEPDFVLVSSLFEGAEGGAVTSIGKSAGLTTAAILYDLIPLSNPEAYLGEEWVRNWYTDKVSSLNRADLVLAISEHAREEGIQRLAMEPERVVNMSSAISENFVPVALNDDNRRFLGERFGIFNSFVMFSGALDPRKNVDGLLKGFALLEPEIQQKTQLVIAGRIVPDETRRLDALMDDLGIREHVVFTGYISDEELALLYSAAAVYVFPSFSEGFGLPALEAMACGAPTIGSNTTSIPEVIGRHDALFDPHQPREIAALIRRVLKDSAFELELRAHALQQAKRFSWDATAEKALSAMERVLEERDKSSCDIRASVDQRDASYRKLIQDIAHLDVEHDQNDVDLQEAAVLIARAQAENALLARSGKLPETLRWRVEGPFDSSYSLALVNRCLAEALQHRGHQVGLHSTEGPGDFEPSPAFLARNDVVAGMHKAAMHMPASECDVSSRLLYPPRVADMNSRINFLHAYAWEESGFPQEWVLDFNDALQGISCLSSHVKKILVDNGVSVPLGVCGSGVDHWDRVELDSSLAIPGEGFRFLHVSSCFPRKGVDAMLKAFGEAFSKEDNVCLLIKTFANPHNEVWRWLEEARASKPNYPDVHIIEGDISEGQLKHLYASCDALVAPSRAEGFGLPLAEAMLAGLPVITTDWGGQLDFCNDETAWLVDYEFVKSDTHFELHGSVWAEPNVESLANAMRTLFVLPSSEVRVRVEAAVELLRSRFTWADTAIRLENDVREISLDPVLPKGNAGWITTWNTKCGVATYSENLIAGSSPAIILASEAADRTSADAGNVVRCWHQGADESLALLDREISKRNLDVLFVQFQYGFFDFEAFTRFILLQKAAGRVVIVIMHSTVDPVNDPRKKLAFVADALKACDRILVHSIHDLNRLKRLGVKQNTALFPHGIMQAALGAKSVQRSSFKIATYGFFLPHKGLLELIEAVSIMRGNGTDVELIMVNAEYPISESTDQIRLAQALINEHGLASKVDMITDFLPDQQSLELLCNADVVVFPYQETGESASGAVRYGLASGKPVVVTPLAIFDDVKEIVTPLPGTSPAEIAAGLEHIFKQLQNNDPTILATLSRAENWRNEHEYPALANRLEVMSRQLLRERNAAAGANPLN